jgi:large subunit ribosomal protein L17
MSHRHGNKGRKFGRETDQRRALIKGLASALIDHTSIKTTLPKAKEIVPYVEKLITKAKKGDVHNRRLIISKVATVSSANTLVDEIAPKLHARSSGHLRIVKEEARRGDNAPMARVSFVDDLKEAPVAKAASKPKKVEKHDEKAPAVRGAVKAPRKLVATDKHLSHKPTVTVRKSGER